MKRMIEPTQERSIERDDLDELISVAEADHGAITEEEIQARRDQLHRAREALMCGRDKFSH